MTDDGAQLTDRDRVLGAWREGRPSSIDAEYSQCGVLALECPLGPAGQLYGIDIGKVVTGNEGVIGIVDAIHHHTHAGVLCLCLPLFADAADGEAECSLIAEVPGQIADALGDRADIERIEPIELRAGDDRNRYRDIL